MWPSGRSEWLVFWSVIAFLLLAALVFRMFGVKAEEFARGL